MQRSLLPSLFAPIRTIALLAGGVVLPLVGAPLEAYDLRFIDDPFLVNTRTTGSQAFPALDSNEAGQTVIAFACEDPDLSPGVCVQFYGNTGLRIGGELRVNVFTAGVQSDPDVAIDEAGNAVVVWESTGQDGDLQGVYGRRVAANGAFLGGEFRVNTTTAGQQQNPVVDAQPDGKFWVVWDATNGDGQLTGIVGRCYAANGSPLTGETVMNQLKTSAQSKPAIAMAPDGRFVLSWDTLYYPTGGGSDVAAQRYAANGTRQGSEIRANTFTNQTQGTSDIAILPDGTFVVAWESFGQDGDGHGIYFQRFAANGTTVGGEKRANATTQGLQTAPGVALVPGGDLIVVWNDSNAASLMARCFKPNNQAGPEVTVDDRVSGNGEVAADANGDIVFAYQDTGPEIRGRAARDGQTCVAGDSALCLNGSRFEVEVEWRASNGDVGFGRPMSLTGDTGYFWFFSANNLEMVIKVVDACFAGRYWVFAAGLTNVDVDIVVTDTQTLAAKRYHNPLDTDFLPIQDTEGFVCSQPSSTGPAAAEIATESARIAREVERLARHAAADAPALVADRKSAGTCVANTTSLCLDGNRFRVRASYLTDSGASGNGTAVGVTGDTGYFWFFDSPDNVEVVVKVLEACSFNPYRWVFAAGLTNVQVVLTVTDTVTQQQKTYTNPLDRAYELLADTETFLCD